MTMPLPCMIGTLPRRSGNPKLVVPLPPYCVPSSENSAWFCWIGSSCPLQNAQPVGAKLNDTILISPMNGFAAMLATPRFTASVDETARAPACASWTRREDALQRDAEIDPQARHHVVVREAAARHADRQE